MESINPKNNPRVIIIQKLYAKEFNKESELIFPKHRYKKFIKDVVLGTLERKELIKETIQQHLSEDLSIKRTEKLLIVLLQAAIFELLYRPQTSVNIIINEYLNSSDFFFRTESKKISECNVRQNLKKNKILGERIFNYKKIFFKFIKKK